MKSLKLAATIGLALALAACGGAEEPEEAEETVEAVASDAALPSETAAATEAAETPTEEATPSAAAAATPAVAAAAASVEPASFAMCKACHSVQPGKNGIGPSLAGIMGTKAGDVAGFEFSPAMIASGLTWNDSTMDAYLKDPRGVVPGTKMAFAGMKDDAKRKEVIAYLKTL